MGLRDRIDKLNRRMGWAPHEGESRRDFLARCATRSGYVPKDVYLELVELHDRVARLESLRDGGG